MLILLIPLIVGGALILRFFADGVLPFWSARRLPPEEAREIYAKAFRSLAMGVAPVCLFGFVAVTTGAWFIAVPIFGVFLALGIYLFTRKNSLDNRPKGSWEILGALVSTAGLLGLFSAVLITGYYVVLAKEGQRMQTVMKDRDEATRRDEQGMSLGGAAWTEKALDQQGDPNAKRSGGDRLIDIAVRLGDTASADAILARGGSIAKLNSAGVTLLTDAVRNEKVEMAKWLLDHGANINQPAGEVNPLMLAGTVEMTALLLSHGADPLFPIRQGSPKHGCWVTPMDFAKLRGVKESIQLMQNAIAERAAAPKTPQSP